MPQWIWNNPIKNHLLTIPKRANLIDEQTKDWDLPSKAQRDSWWLLQLLKWTKRNPNWKYWASKACGTVMMENHFGSWRLRTPSRTRQSRRRTPAGRRLPSCLKAWLSKNVKSFTPETPRCRTWRSPRARSSWGSRDPSRLHLPNQKNKQTKQQQNHKAKQPCWPTQNNTTWPKKQSGKIARPTASPIAATSDQPWGKTSRQE